MTQSAKSKNVLISGASIAGPALAWWLNKYGYRVTVIEKAPALRQGGYRIDIRGAAVDVAEKMSIMDQVRQLAISLRSTTIVDGRGRNMASFEPDMMGMRNPGDVEILRGDLSNILYEATKAYTEYIFSESITGMEEEEDGVLVSFQHGESRKFDLIVGADGLHSNVRALVFGEEKNYVRDLGYYISIFSIPNHFGLQNRELGYLTAGRGINVCNTGSAQDTMAAFLFSSPLLRYDYRNAREQMAILTDNFKNAGWQSLRILASMEDAPDFYFDSISQVHMESYSKGRIVLLGDACYCPSPASGQGTSLALVGAYVLAGELTKANGDHTIGFPAYMKEMRPYVCLNQEMGVTVLKQMIPKTAKEVRMQTFFLRVMLRLPWRARLIRRMMGKMNQAVNQAANGITLQEY